MFFYNPQRRRRQERKKPPAGKARNCFLAGSSPEGEISLPSPPPRRSGLKPSRTHRLFLVPQGFSHALHRLKTCATIMQIETSAKSHFVILSAAKDLMFPHTSEILRSLRSLRMTGAGTFAEVSNLYENSSVGRASVPASERRPGTAAPPTPAFFHLSLCPQGNDRWYETQK